MKSFPGDLMKKLEPYRSDIAAIALAQLFWVIIWVIGVILDYATKSPFSFERSYLVGVILIIIPVVWIFVRTTHHQAERLTERIKKMKSRKNEVGQGLIEYALILLGVAIVVGCCIAVVWFAIGKAILNWPGFMEWLTSLVAGVQAGNPYSIATAIMAGLGVLFLLFLFFGNRRR